jgi:LCP family protein required for cell wall assembly
MLADVAVSFGGLPHRRIKREEVPLQRKTLLRIIVVLIVIVLFALALFAVDRFTANRIEESSPAPTASQTVQDPYEDDDGVARVFYNGAWYSLKEDIETILVMGVDDSGEQRDYGSNINHAQADFLLLMIIDDAAQSYCALQLNRDTMTDITVVGTVGDIVGTRVAQLALAHTYGSGLADSCCYTVKAVSELLHGVEIDHYAALSMDAIGIMNEQVGGVTVTVPVDMSTYDEALTQGATVTLNADQAEIFVRCRKDVDDSTNLSRMKRQQLFMAAWKDQVRAKAESDSNFALELVLSISDYLVSDMSAFALSDFASAMIDYEDQGTLETQGESVLGEEYMEFYVDEDALYQQVIDLFYELDPTDSDAT